MRPVLNHLRQNAIAYLALFVALGGTSYAAINLPAGSIGSKQLRNGSITPVKFNGNYINGSIRAWVQASASGEVEASAGSPTVVLGHKGIPGFYFIRWKVTAPRQRGCSAVGGITAEATEPGATEISLQAVSKHLWNVFVRTFGAQGQALAQPFYAAVIC
jgi:hypothetical protein